MNNIVLLLKRYFLLNKRPIFTAYLAIALSVMLIFFFMTMGMRYVAYHEMSIVYFVIYVVAGWVLTSLAFQELNTPAKSSFYLILPASHTEKFATQYLIVSVFYSIVAFVTFILVSVVGASLASLLFDIDFAFNGFSLSLHMKIIGIYLATHAVFFAGGLYFKSGAFFKTILIVILFAMALAFTLSLFQFLFTRGTSIDMSFNEVSKNPVFFVNYIAPALKVTFWFIQPAFFLVLSYFKLTEKEV
jgi:hypothetical protein